MSPLLAKMLQKLSLQS